MLLTPEVSFFLLKIIKLHIINKSSVWTFMLLIIASPDYHRLVIVMKMHHHNLDHCTNFVVDLLVDSIVGQNFQAVVVAENINKSIK